MRWKGLLLLLWLLLLLLLQAMVRGRQGLKVSASLNRGRASASAGGAICRRGLGGGVGRGSRRSGRLGGGLAEFAVMFRRRDLAGFAVVAAVCTTSSHQIVRRRRRWGLGAGGGLGEAVSDVVLLGVNFLVLFKILRSLEGLGADVASVVLEGNVDANVGGDVVALGADGKGTDCGSARCIFSVCLSLSSQHAPGRFTAVPMTRQTELCREVV